MARTSAIASSMVALALSFAATQVLAQQGGRPDILGDRQTRAQNPLPDYSYAGYGFGLAAIPMDQGTVIEATAHGVIPDDGKDDAKALLAALAAANAIEGRVIVRLPAGRVQIGEVIPLTRSNLTLAGAGSAEGGTELFFPRPLNIVDDPARQAELREYLLREDKYEVQPDQNIRFLFSEYSWAGGMLFVGPEGTRPVSYDGSKDRRDPVLAEARGGRQFDTVLAVADASKLRVGQVVQVQWFSVDGPDSAILHSLYGDLEPWNSAQTENSRKLAIGSHHWTFPNRPVVAQPTRIIAIRGNRVTLGDPLLHAVSADQPAVVAQWGHLEDVGIQNMRLTFPDNPWFGHHLEAGYNGIYMTGVFDGWIHDLVIANADSAVLTDNAGSLTISDIVTTGEHKAHYSVHVGAVHNVLVDNLRVENPVIHPVSVNTRSSRSVYRQTTVLRDAIIDQHSGSNHQNLFDGLTMHVAPRQTDGGWRYRLWEGGGAGYWKPGHGLMNTHWNVALVMPDSVPADATVTIASGLEGPGARIVGLHANRTIAIDYAPTAYQEMTGTAVTAVPSLYDHQLEQRRRAATRR